jgi:TPR repeat protein
VAPDHAEAANLLRTAAEFDDPLAHFALGEMYLDGIYFSADSARANDHFRSALPGLEKAANEGDVEAMIDLGTLCVLGFVPGKTSGLDWYRSAAEQGHARAQYYLGWRYHHGMEVAQNDSVAVVWLERAAAGGQSAAQRLLANHYFTGSGVDRDEEKAKHWLREGERWPSGSEAYRDGIYTYRGIPAPGDSVISRLLPPRGVLDIPEGSCGETCLWSLLRAGGHEATLIDINSAGGEPGRGLHSYELHRVLDRFNFEYVNTMGRKPAAYGPMLIGNFFANLLKRNHDAKYRHFLYDQVIPSVRAGRPVILGLKKSPTQHGHWPIDHFVLVVGYNVDRDLLIINDNSRRRRLPASSLLTGSAGYTLVNRYGALSAIFVDLPGS